MISHECRLNDDLIAVHYLNDMLLGLLPNFYISHRTDYITRHNKDNIVATTI